MNEPRIECDTLQAFLDEAARLGVRGVGLRAVHELRPRHLAGHRVEVGAQKWVELSGYANGTLVVARLDGADGPQIQHVLEERGITVRSGSGNIT
jgi:hypothetical protein